VPGCGAHAGNLVVRDLVHHELVEPVIKSAKVLAVALKNTRLRVYLKQKLGVSQDHRIGVPLCSCAAMPHPAFRNDCFGRLIAASR